MELLVLEVLVLELDVAVVLVLVLVVFEVLEDVVLVVPIKSYNSNAKILRIRPDAL